MIVQAIGGTSLDTAGDIRWDFETLDLGRVRREISRVLKPYAMEADTAHEYRARLCHRRLREVDLTLMEYGGPVSIDAGRINDSWLLHVPLLGHYAARSRGCSRRVGTGDAHLVNPRMRLAMECSTDLRLLVLRFGGTRLTSAELALRWQPEAEEIGHTLWLEHGDNRSLGRLVDYVARELTEGVLFQQRPHLLPGLEDLLLASLDHALNRGAARNKIATPYYVRRAEKYILDQLTADLGLDDIVAASGVSASTLFRGFRAVHGQGPLGWVRDQRLEQVHRDLLTARRKPRISDIALRWGFTHLGNFCAAYRARYGQTPSESLKSIS